MDCPGWMRSQRSTSFVVEVLASVGRWIRNGQPISTPRCCYRVKRSERHLSYAASPRRMVRRTGTQVRSTQRPLTTRERRYRDAARLVVWLITMDRQNGLPTSPDRFTSRCDFPRRTSRLNTASRASGLMTQLTVVQGTLAMVMVNTAILKMAAFNMVTFDRRSFVRPTMFRWFGDARSNMPTGRDPETSKERLRTRLGHRATDPAGQTRWSTNASRASSKLPLGEHHAAPIVTVIRTPNRARCS